MRPYLTATLTFGLSYNNKLYEEKYTRNVHFSNNFKCLYDRKPKTARALTNNDKMELRRICGVFAGNIAQKLMKRLNITLHSE